MAVDGGLVGGSPTGVAVNTVFERPVGAEVDAFPADVPMLTSDLLPLPMAMERDERGDLSYNVDAHWHTKEHMLHENVLLDVNDVWAVAPFKTPTIMLTNDICASHAELTKRPV